MESKKSLTPSTPRRSMLDDLTAFIRNTYSSRESMIATAITFLFGLTPMTAGFNPFGVAFFFASMLPTVPMAVGLFFSSATCGTSMLMPIICSTVGAVIKSVLSKKGKLNFTSRVILSSSAGLIGGLCRMPFVVGDVGEPIRTILLSLTVPLFCVIFIGLEHKNDVFGTAHEVVVGSVFCFALHGFFPF